ncbi:MAG: hypothetical protein DWH73_00940 [Planctomycetota bacterium]|nr:MAG: hypothetical protein DWH73_00940 [Planctomycetota bacterium]
MSAQIWIHASRKVQGNGLWDNSIELHNIFTSKPDFVKPQFVRDNGFTTRNSKPADNRTDKFAVAAVAKPFTQKT